MFDYGFISVYLVGLFGEWFEVVLRGMIDVGFMFGLWLCVFLLEKGVEGVMGVFVGYDLIYVCDILGFWVYVKVMVELGVDLIKFLMLSDDGFVFGGV